MDNDPQKDELQVEHYDAETAKEKRIEILTKVGIGVTAAVVLGFLIVAGGSSSAVGGSGSWYASVVVPLGDSHE